MKPLLSISESALAHIAQIRAHRKQGEGVGFRLGVKPSGCSGWLYQPEIVDSIDPDDEVIHCNELQIMIPKCRLDLLKGTHIDIEDKGLGQKVLIYLNPNADSECGCGESFSVSGGNHD